MTKITFQIDVPNDKVADVVDSIATSLGYNDVVGAKPTKAEFIRSHVLAFLKQRYHSGKSQVAIEQAKHAVETEINSVIIQ